METFIIYKIVLSQDPLNNDYRKNFLLILWSNNLHKNKKNRTSKDYLN